MTTRDLEEVARLRLYVLRLARRARQQSGTDLTPSQLSALTTIARRGPMRLGELAEREGIGKSSVTRQVARLEETGLVSTVSDPDDGRSSLVSITARGNRLLEESSRRVDAYLARQVAALGPADREQLYATLEVLEHLLDVRA